MKINEVIGEQIDWNALWKAGAVMPYMLDSPESRANGLKPDPKSPNIFTPVNVRSYPRKDPKIIAAGGDRIEGPLSISQISFYKGTKIFLKWQSVLSE